MKHIANCIFDVKSRNLDILAKFQYDIAFRGIANICMYRYMRLIPFADLTLYLRRCTTSSVGQSVGLSVPRSSVRFRQILNKSRTQIYMGLRYIDPQARVLNYCSKQSKQSSIKANDEVILSLSLSLPLSFLLGFVDMRISLRCASPHLFVPHCVCGRTCVQVCVWMSTGER